MKRFSSLIRFGRILSSANPKENKFTNELQEIARNDSGLIANLSKSLTSSDTFKFENYY